MIIKALTSAGLGIPRVGGPLRRSDFPVIRRQDSCRLTVEGSAGGNRSAVGQTQGTYLTRSALRQVCHGRSTRSLPRQL